LRVVDEPYITKTVSQFLFIYLFIYLLVSTGEDGIILRSFILTFGMTDTKFRIAKRKIKFLAKYCNAQNELC